MEWISVKDNLPKDGQRVRAKSTNILGEVTFMVNIENIPMWVNGNFEVIDKDSFYLDDNGFVTHWMPLPELPKNL